MILSRVILPALLIVVLAACKAIPIPLEIDLLAKLGDAASGTIEKQIVAGSAYDVRKHIPEAGESCLVLDDDRRGVTLVHANLTYELDLAYDGPPISGVVEVQAYLAADEEALFSDAAALGAPVRVDLASPTVTLGDSVRLDRYQIAAVNDRRVCVGLLLVGTDLSAEEDGVASIDYDVKQLRLRISFSVF